jgi:hypothetical protein
MEINQKSKAVYGPGSLKTTDREFYARHEFRENFKMVATFFFLVCYPKFDDLKSWYNIGITKRPNIQRQLILYPVSSTRNTPDLRSCNVTR